MDTKNLILELPEISLDKQKLINIFESVKSYGRVKGLPWKEYSLNNISLNRSKCIVITDGDYMMLDHSASHLSINLLGIPYIKELVSKIKFDHEILSNNIDILWYKPGFIFEPHIDGYAASTMIVPIISNTSIDFYENKNLNIEKGKSATFENIVTFNDLIYSHRYNCNFPTIFNSHIIHGIGTITKDRVCLRLKINEPFESIIDKYINNKLW